MVWRGPRCLQVIFGALFPQSPPQEIREEEEDGIIYSVYRKEGTRKGCYRLWVSVGAEISTTLGVHPRTRGDKRVPGDQTPNWGPHIPSQGFSSQGPASPP